MRLWQKSMIALATSPRLIDAMHRSDLMQRLSERFVGGSDAAAAVARALELERSGRTSSLFFLGEYVADPALIERSVTALLDVIARLSATELELHVSVDPTQAGSMLDWSLCQSNVRRIAEAMAGASTPGAARRVLMLDMEDSSVTQRTLELHQHLRATGLPAAVTVQAYLRRSAEDVRHLVALGATVRLVKGALAEGAGVAYTSRADIDASYRALVEQLLGPEARARGVYPAFGTHDEAMVAHAQRVAQANGWQRHQWEVEMLLGVRPALQRQLVARGLAVRLYLPFGERFWPYTIRRVGENPRNLSFVLQALRPG